MSKAAVSGQGHRARMRERILRHGAETLADYELLEVLLFYAIPRRDTKPQAKALLARFGSLGALLQASPHEMREHGVSGAVMRLLSLPPQALRALMASETMPPVQLGDSRALMRYLTGALHRVEHPAVGLLCLDSGNTLIGESVLPVADNLRAVQGEIARQLLACHATAAIIAYYHPGAPATALAPEIRGLRQALDPLGIAVHEAVLVGEGWHVSMKGAGLI